MATFVLVPGAGSTSWYWHLVEPALRARGHDVVAVDLPCDDDGAGFEEYADAVLDAVGDRATRDDLVVVGQSMGAYTAALVCTRLPAMLLVLVAAMVPAPGETGGEWWRNTGHRTAVDPDDVAALFLHDLPADLAAEAGAHVRDQSSTPFERPWPVDAWPEVPTRFLLCRDDRFFPADFLRPLVQQRLGIDPDEMDGGHLPALARPEELAARLDAYCW